MKGLGRLIKNELIKLSHQTSFRVISVIVLVLCIISPAISIGANKLIGYIGDKFNDPTSNAEEYRALAEEYPDSNVQSVILRSYYTAYADAFDFFADNGIDDWRYSYYSSEYLYYTEIIAGLELINSGFSPDDVAAVFTYLYDINESESNDELIFTNVTSTIISYRSMREELGEAALNSSVNDIFTNALSSLKPQIAQLEKYYASAKLELEAAPDSPELQYNFAYADSALTAYNSLAEAYEYLGEFVNDYDDWRVTLVFNGLQEAYIELPDLLTVPESEFENSDELSYTYDSYSAYKKATEKEYEEQCKAIRLMEYSLYHNIPTPQAMQLSPKLTWQTSLTSLMGTIGILLVILAGSSVASEFSQGTIRLLLIRPKKRSKILASKLLSLLIVLAGYMLCAYVVMFAVSMIFGGIGDIIAPDLLTIGESVVEVTPFITTFARMLICSVTPIILTLFAFMLSVITRKTSLSIALPLVYSQIVSGIVFSIGSVLSIFYGFVKYTPLLYTDMSGFNTYFLSQYVSGSSLSGIIQSVTGTASALSGGVLAIGLAYNFAAAIIITAISFAVFSRKEIK